MKNDGDTMSNMSNVMRKPAFCICGKKDADQAQLLGNREADQRLCLMHGRNAEKIFFDKFTAF